MTECELGKILISDLNEKGITNIFQEVVVDGGESCDIVYKKDDIYNFIEMKMEFNLKVISQALRWIKNGKSWIAIPEVEHKKDSYYQKLSILKALNIGLIIIRPYDHRVFYANFANMPRDFPYKIDIEKYLSIEHCADCEAGSQHGNRSTPFSRTVEMIKNYKNEHKEATLKECIGNVNHHYSNDKSAISSIKKYLARSIIKIDGFN